MVAGAPFCNVLEAFCCIGSRIVCLLQPFACAKFSACATATASSTYRTKLLLSVSHARLAGFADNSLQALQSHRWQVAQV
jgi:hypothetical protein